MVKDQLLLQIHQKRQEMIGKANKKGFTNNSVVQCSQELDKLLNKYHYILMVEKSENNPTIETLVSQISTYSLFEQAL